MRKSTFAVIGLLTILAMLLAPVNSAPSVAARTLPPERMPKELPAEVIEAFKGGITAEELLARYDGPVPAALWAAVDEPVSVIVEMDQPSLIASMQAQGTTPSQMGAAAQRSYAQGLLQAQTPLVAEVQARGGAVLGQYTKVYNGALVRIKGSEVDALRKMAGVKAVHRAPRHTIELTNSVPLIDAPEVWEALPTGYDGSGVTIAVIDSGIDYTHASFGGVGTAIAYSSNDPDVIEAGSFPTAKVIGGYDFAGTAYNASSPVNSIPVPDDDPLDEGGHGTHVSSTAAGMPVLDAGMNVLVGPGVAPGASLYALKVFGAAGSTDLVINALDWAMDPNGDGDLSDRVDVINMSLGSIWGTASADDPEQVAVNLISSLGTFVAVSAGNESDSSYVVGQPSISDAAISVAASTTGFVTMPVVQYDNNTQFAPYNPGNPFTTAVTAVLVDVDMVDGTPTGELCTTTVGNPASDLLGKVALVQRGGCDFAVKIANAATLGAVGIIIYNQVRPDDDFISMVTGTTTLPAGHTTRPYGLALKAFHGTSVTVGPDSSPKTVPFGSADTVGSFSSRGPRGYDSKLKPEITAPGVAIFAAYMGTGNQGTSMNGTSMAAPHVAGVAALIADAHPDWSAEKIKAAMMSTAVDLSASDANGYRIVPRTGAGRVDADGAVFAQTIVTGDPNLVSLSWGLVEVGMDTPSYVVPEAKLVRVENLAGASKTYDIAVTFSSPTMTGATLNLPSTVTVAAGATVGVPVTLTLNPALLPQENHPTLEYALNFGVMEEYYGFVTFTPQGGGAAVRVPFYFVPRPYSKLSEAPGGDHSVNADGLTPANITFNQSGPKTSNLWVWPALVVDPNEPGIQDAGDLRAAGIDLGFVSGTYGNVLAVAIANWGKLHTLQPYFDETDLHIDADRDGTFEYTLWNFNYGWLSGGDQDNTWVVLVTDHTIPAPSPNIFLASPYTITADFNSGYSEWYVPAGWIPLSTSTFNYRFISYDAAGNADVTPAGTFDYARYPYYWELSDFIPGGGGSTVLSVYMNSTAGYLISKPQGVILADYYGQPGLGQSYVIPLTAESVPTIYIPYVGK